MSGYFRPSPWAMQALTPDEVAGLHARIVALGCLVTTERSKSGGWTIYASDRAVTASRYGAKGSLAVAIHAVLDDYRSQRAAVDEDVARYTPEELVTIAEQSGIAVSRG